MKRLLVFALLLAVLATCPGCFMIFGLGNTEIHVNDPDTVKTGDIAATAEAQGIPQ